ncbi:MAG: methylenetetrahydrofolate reductase [Dehalococcoidia bacterium]
MTAQDSLLATQPTVVDLCADARRDGRVLVACDVSPPRGATIEALAEIAAMPADLYCVAYAPGRAVRLDSLAMAVVLRATTGRGTTFNLATRDMNKLALQNHLLGAEALGQPNVVIVRGDELTTRDQGLFKAVHDYTPSALVAATAAMNEGKDFRGNALRSPARLCGGATMDLARGAEDEARLAGRKVRAGARFFLTQPIYSPEEAEHLMETYRSVNDDNLTVPVFWGFPVLAAESITFGEPPERWRSELAAGRPSADLAAEELQRFTAAGLTTLYVMAPILRGGARDYTAAATALSHGLGRA